MPEQHEPITVTLNRSEWAMILEAASSYDVRIPREQGDGGHCLDLIRVRIQKEEAHRA